MDCLQRAVNTQSLANLKALQKPSIGIYTLDDKEILNFENFKNLESLILVDTKTKSLNLDYLKNYKILNF